ncbi:hypothetical protein SISSUDRAFT_1118100 [Sistotremastrum suecicum HHB10207 ss-3]|uniref:Mediator of RNA polymerase II transcription subunit 13 n=1 Tax=Sistotremastrum suecicum HHB10207 ss-3 TaxID=1314776 RepID=A0A166FIV0_9AGAM|nr:hypothetical protein SISSUDRAFT_1118100 [Sistotremastrum suecicum HHB10207 ss-3]
MTTRTFHPLPKRPVTIPIPPPPQASSLPPIHLPISTPQPVPQPSVAHTTTASPAAISPQPQTTNVHQQGGPPVHLPPNLTLSSKLLASSIALKEGGSIFSAKYTGSQDALHTAKEYILSQWAKTLPLECLLLSIEGADLTVFKYGEGQPELNMDGLTRASHTTFGTSDERAVGFLNALRMRIIHDVVCQSRKPGRKIARKYSEDSFIVISPSISPERNEWGTGWDEGKGRPLLKVSLTLSLTTSNILIMPSMSFVPCTKFTPSCPALTPIRLLPFSTPAYYASPFTPSCLRMESELRSQFSNVMNGHGGIEPIPAFVKVWIPLKATETGRETGVTCVYPTSLVLIDFSPSRPPLQNLPVSAISPTSPLSASSSSRNHVSHPGQTLRQFAFNARAPSLEGRAKEIGAFVDEVVKEREREKERVRKDRELAAQIREEQQASGSTASSPLKSVQHQSPPASTPSAIPNSIHPHLQDQHFYPSPPVQHLPANSPSNLFQNSWSPHSPMIVRPEAPPPAPPPPDPTPPPPDPAAALQADTATDPWFDLDLDMMRGSEAPQGDVVMDFGEGPSNLDARAPNKLTSFDFDKGDYDFFDAPDPIGNPVVMSSPKDPSPLDVLSKELDDAFQFGSPVHATILNIPTPIAPVPDLISSSLRGPSPASPPSPPTPEPYVDGASRFDPIEWTDKYVETDRKYLNGNRGKFSLMQSDEHSRILQPPKTPQSWRGHYRAKTDPRLQVVQMIRLGRKRLRLSADLDMRSMGALEPEKTNRSRSPQERFAPGIKPGLKKHMSWSAGWDDWESTSSTAGSPLHINNGSAHSFDPDDSDDDSMADDIIPDEPPCNRESPPEPPVVLPLGHSLISSRFQYSTLLSYATTLLTSSHHDSASSSSPIFPSHTPACAPTPVSPGATSADRRKLLEQIANALSTELVDNPIWAEEWVLAGRQSQPEKHYGDVQTLKESLSRSDLVDLRTLLGAPLAADGGSVSLQTVCMPAFMRRGSTSGAPKLQLMKPPSLAVAQSRVDEIMQIQPSSLKFWNKMGLGPRGGQKDAPCYVVFEEQDGGEGEQRKKEVCDWMTRLCDNYENRSLGTLKPGHNPEGSHGIVPVRWETCCKRILDLKLKRQNSKHRFLVHLVPQFLTREGSRAPSSPRHSLDSLTLVLYDRLLRSVERLNACRFHPPAAETVDFFQVPAFTIARGIPNINLTAEYPTSTLDVTEHHLLLHIAYKVSHCGRWLVAVCMDQYGEAHDTRVWLGGAGNPDEEVGTPDSHGESVEWRIVFTKLGSLSSEELRAWESHLTATLPQIPGLSMHVTVISAQTDVPWWFYPVAPTITKEHFAPPSNIWSDISSSSYALVLPLSLPNIQSTPSPAFDLPPSNASSNVSSPVSMEVDETPTFQTSPKALMASALITIPSSSHHHSLDCHVFNSTLHIFLLHTAASPKSTMMKPTQEHLEDITRNFYELSILADNRWSGAHHKLHSSCKLPFHIAAAELVMEGIDRPDNGLNL